MADADIGASTGSAPNVNFPIAFNNTSYHQLIQGAGSAADCPTTIVTARNSASNIRVSQKVKTTLGAHLVAVGY